MSKPADRAKEIYKRRLISVFRWGTPTPREWGLLADIVLDATLDGSAKAGELDKTVAAPESEALFWAIAENGGSRCGDEHRCAMCGTARGEQG